jgi:hypothetical protein
MKKILLLFCILWAGKSIAQTAIVNSGGAKIVITAGTDLKAQNIRNDGAGSQITNNGDLYLKGNFNQTNSAIYTGGASSWLWFEGTTTQTIQSDATLNIARLKIDNASGVQLSQNMNVATDLSIVNGDLDLNGKNIDLGATGTLSEDRANNHLVKDLTATSDYAQGGGVLFTSTVTDATTEIRGTGLYLQGNAGANYPVTVARKHYKGATPSRGGTGIARIYAITGTPNQPTTMRIYYASDETTGISGTYALYRWQSATGWKKATDLGSGFANGTNGMGYAEATGINAFSTWTVGAEETPLPITLLGLKGERVEGLRGESTEEVRLEWATASEINNKGFEVEMSEDGLAYQKIAFVEGKGNSLTSNIYQLITIQPNDAYYRFRQVDFDGKFSYSPVVFVEGVASKVVVYPNPNNGTFKIEVGKDKLDSPARLLNAQGIEVWRGVQTEARTTDLPSGVYFLHTTVTGKTQIIKIVIEK